MLEDDHNPGSGYDSINKPLEEFDDINENSVRVLLGRGEDYDAVPVPEQLYPKERPQFASEFDAATMQL